MIRLRSVPLLTRRWRPGATVVLGLLLVLFGTGTPVRAAGVVGNGMPESCTEFALNVALADASGMVEFNCGPAPVVITLTSPKTITTRNITINGGSGGPPLITLSGGNTTRLFTVSLGRVLTLQHLVLSNGFAGSADGGAIFNSGTLNLDHVTIQNSSVNSGFRGGAIDTTGDLSVTDSELANNGAYDGGGISVVGATAQVTLTRTLLHDNQASNTGGGFFILQGTANLVDGEVHHNGAQLGGGLYVDQNATVTLQGAAVHDNQVTLQGGGIYSTGTLTLTDATLDTNRAPLEGAGLFTANGTSTLTRTMVRGNQSGSGSNLQGGGIYREGNANQTLILTDVMLSGNQATRGGGLFSSGPFTFTRGTISGNQADQLGGGIFVMGFAYTLTDVTLSGNTATGSNGTPGLGGGLESFDGNGTLVNVTFEGNSAFEGGAIYNSAGQASQGLTLKNTILADSPGGGNCAQNGPGLIVSQGFNLATDTTCDSSLTQPNDQRNQPAGLGPLANNGGLTQTHLPQPSSRAIDRGTNAGCPPTDQRGLPRPVGAACDIGAVEVQQSDLTSPTPTVTLTSTATPTATVTPTASVSPTSVPTGTSSATATGTATLSPTATGTLTPSPMATATATSSRTATSSSVPSGTPTLSPAATVTRTPTLTPGLMPTRTPSATPLGAAPCADINQDGLVDIVDFSLLRSSFGLSSGAPGFLPRADIDRNGLVDIVDFSLLRAAFGTSTTCGTV